MRYEMMRIAQLVFFLTIMFGAFLGGLAVGWARWGRPHAAEEDTEEPRARPPRHATPNLVKPDLFAPEAGPGGPVGAGALAPAEIGPAGRPGGPPR
jgi:hypothetical protein